MESTGSNNNILSQRKGPLRVIAFITLWSFLFSLGGGEYLIELARLRQGYSGQAWAAERSEGLSSTNPKVSGSPSLNVEEIEIPVKLGRTSYARQGTSDRTVFLIQDAHCNYDAQHKIAEIIEYLSSAYKIDVVNLEGGHEDYDLFIFEDIKDKTAKENVADYFVKEGVLNGAEYYAINNPSKVKLWGIENTELYLKNLNTYKDSLYYKTEVKNYLDELGGLLEAQKLKYFSKTLLKFDEKYMAYKNGEIELAQYIQYLKSIAGENSINIKKYENAALLGNMINQEGYIDFRQAEAERSMLIDRLEKGLSITEVEEMVIKAVEFKAGNIEENTFYGFLSEKANSLRINIKAYPELEKYLRYMNAYKNMDKIALMDEITALEEEIKSTLCGSEKERFLMTLSKNLYLMKNMFALTLTREDYDYYRENKESFLVSNYLSLAANLTLDDKLAGLDAYREKMDEFFEYSFERDDAFLRNMKFSNNSQAAIMITGGFHTENLARLLKDKNISFVCIMPNFKCESGYESPYFRLLAGEENKVLTSLESTVSVLAWFTHFCGDSSAIHGSKDEAVKGWILLRKAIETGENEFTLKTGKGEVLYRLIAENDQVPEGFIFLEEVKIEGKALCCKSDIEAKAVKPDKKHQKRYTGWRRLLRPQFSVRSVLLAVTLAVSLLSGLFTFPQTRLTIWTMIYAKWPSEHSVKELYEANEEMIKKGESEALRNISYKRGLNENNLYPSYDIGMKKFVVSSSAGLDITDKRGTLIEDLAEEVVRDYLNEEYGYAFFDIEIISTKLIGVSDPPLMGNVEVTVKIKDTGNVVTFILDLVPKMEVSTLYDLDGLVSVTLGDGKLIINIATGPNVTDMYEIDLVSSDITLNNRPLEEPSDRKEAAGSLKQTIEEFIQGQEDLLAEGSLLFLNNGRETFSEKLGVLGHVVDFFGQIEENEGRQLYPGSSLGRNILRNIANNPYPYTIFGIIIIGLTADTVLRKRNRLLRKKDNSSAIKLASAFKSIDEDIDSDNVKIDSRSSSGAMKGIGPYKKTTEESNRLLRREARYREKLEHEMLVNEKNIEKRPLNGKPDGLLIMRKNLGRLAAAFHFDRNENDKTTIIVLNNNARYADFCVQNYKILEGLPSEAVYTEERKKDIYRKIEEEAIYHELREKYWTGVLRESKAGTRKEIDRQAHIIASAEVVSNDRFKVRGGLTFYHYVELKSEAMNMSGLLSMIFESRKYHKGVVQKAYKLAKDGYAVAEFNLVRVRMYERSLRARAAAEIAARIKKDIVTNSIDFIKGIFPAIWGRISDNWKRSKTVAVSEGVALVSLAALLTSVILHFSYIVSISWAISSTAIAVVGIYEYCVSQVEESSLVQTANISSVTGKVMLAGALTISMINMVVSPISSILLIAVLPPIIFLGLGTIVTGTLLLSFAEVRERDYSKASIFISGIILMGSFLAMFGYFEDLVSYGTEIVRMLLEHATENYSTHLLGAMGDVMGEVLGIAGAQVMNMLSGSGIYAAVVESMDQDIQNEPFITSLAALYEADARRAGLRKKGMSAGQLVQMSRYMSAANNGLVTGNIDFEFVVSYSNGVTKYVTISGDSYKEQEFTALIKTEQANIANLFIHNAAWEIFNRQLLESYDGCYQLDYSVLQKIGQHSVKVVINLDEYGNIISMGSGMQYKRTDVEKVHMRSNPVLGNAPVEYIGDIAAMLKKAELMDKVKVEEMETYIFEAGYNGDIGSLKRIRLEDGMFVLEQMVKSGIFEIIYTFSELGRLEDGLTNRMQSGLSEGAKIFKTEDIDSLSALKVAVRLNRAPEDELVITRLSNQLPALFIETETVKSDKLPKLKQWIIFGKNTVSINIDTTRITETADTIVKEIKAGNAVILKFDLPENWDEQEYGILRAYYERIERNLFIISNALDSNFGKTKNYPIKNIGYSINEALKNAFVHGNKLREDLPIVFFMELNEQDRIKSFEVYDTAVEGEPDRQKLVQAKNALLVHDEETTPRLPGEGGIPWAKRFVEYEITDVKEPNALGLRTRAILRPLIAERSALKDKLAKESFAKLAEKQPKASTRIPLPKLALEQKKSFEDVREAVENDKLRAPQSQAAKTARQVLASIKQPDFSTGGRLVPNAIAVKLLKRPFVELILKEIPDGCVPLGYGATSVVLKTPDNLALRIQEGTVQRLDIKEMLQPVSGRTKVINNWTLEWLPLAETENITQADIDDMKVRLAFKGYKLSDDFTDNLGRVNGELYVIDPYAVIPIRYRSKKPKRVEAPPKPPDKTTGVDKVRTRSKVIKDDGASLKNKDYISEDGTNYHLSLHKEDGLYRIEVSKAADEIVGLMVVEKTQNGIFLQSVNIFNEKDSGKGLFWEMMILTSEYFQEAKELSVFIENYETLEAIYDALPDRPAKEKARLGAMPVKVDTVGTAVQTERRGIFISAIAESLAKGWKAQVELLANTKLGKGMKAAGFYNNMRLESGEDEYKKQVIVLKSDKILVYSTAEKSVSPIVNAMRRNAPTFVVEPSLSWQTHSPLVSMLRKTEDEINGKGHNIHARTYLLDNPNEKQSMEYIVGKSVEDFVKYLNDNPEEDQIAQTRLVVRVIREDGDEDRIEKLLQTVKEKVSTLGFSAMNNIKFVHVSIDSVDKNKQHLNTVIDLFTDILMMECDRWTSGAYGDEIGIPDGLGEMFKRMLSASIANYDDFELAVTEAGLKGKEEIAFILERIFDASIKLKIMPIDWESIKDWKENNDSILMSL